MKYFDTVSTLDLLNIPYADKFSVMKLFLCGRNDCDFSDLSYVIRKQTPIFRTQRANLSNQTLLQVCSILCCNDRLPLDLFQSDLF
jgi:hypothetical protein